MQPLITLKNVSKIFDADGVSLEALKDINLEISAGEFFVVLGPSGSGKSTLLRIMSGLEKEYRGEVRLAADVSLRDFSFVFQQFALLPWLTVAENVAFGLLARGMPLSERKKRVNRELNQLGLEKFADAYPRELSGGMRQRVGIARALATEPKVIFMDEPFSELDSFTAEELRKEILAIWQERHITVVMVTHIISEALELGDRIAVLTPRPGRIEEIVENNLPRPRVLRSEDFYRLEDRLHKLVRP
jgi:ABC-type nitrate/sulfonate/bicarbonate transport system ATPase subunit